MTISANTNSKKLLSDFNKIAQNITPPSGLRVEVGGALIREISFFLTRFLQKIGHNKRKIAPWQGKDIILNIGCGDFVRGNFLTTDIFPTGGEFLKFIVGKRKLKNDLFLDITYYDKSLSNCAKGIVLSHVLEHIPPVLALTSLRHCFDYLKSGGCLRISVPYLGVYEGADWPGSQKLASATLAKNRLIYGWGHKFMYDVELLAILLIEAGFKEVKEVQFGEGLLSETDNPNRRQQSIYLTGIKP